MRAELHGHSETVRLFNEEELTHFRSPAQAELFLKQFLHEPENIDVLRRVLRDECGLMLVAHLNNEEVISEVARRLVRACVAVTKQDLPPSVPPDLAGADGPIIEAVSDARPLGEELEAEFEDTKPDPIIPPEYIAVANRETSCIELRTKVYKVVLDLLRFVGMDGTDESEIGKTYNSVGSTEGAAIDGAVGGIGTVLASAKAGGDAKAQASKVGPQLQEVAGDAGQSISDKAEAVSRGLEQGGDQAGPPEAELGSEFRKLADEQGRGLTVSASAAGGKLSGAGDLPDHPEPTVHVVQKGESLSKIAALYGMGFAAWRKIYDHPDNEPLREKRPNPNLIQPGDEVVIPLPPLKRPPKDATVGIELQNADGTPRANERYSVTLEGGATRTGELDHEGRATLTKVVPGGCTVVFPKLQAPWRDGEGQAPPLRVHVVKRGEWLSKIGKKYGISWRTLYYHPTNEAFRKKRPNPDKIYPGDKLVIPDEKPREVTVPTGQNHVFKIVGPDAPPDTGDVVDAEEAQAQDVEQAQQIAEETGNAELLQEVPAVQQAEAFKAEPDEDPDDYTLLFDTESGLVYRIPNEMLAEMRVSAEKLARIRDDIKAAKGLPKDQRENAVQASVKELHDYCAMEPKPYEPFKPKEVMEGRGWRRHEYWEAGGTPIREFVVFEKKELIFVPRNGQSLLESKFRGRMKTTSIKDAVETNLDDEADEAAKGPTTFEIKWSSGIEAKGSGSLLDMIDSSDPSWSRLLMAQPAMLPLWLADKIGEKFPRFFRKNHGGKWEPSPGHPRFDGSWEARFGRYAYEAKAAEFIFDPARGEVRLESKASGHLSLAEGKVDLGYWLPTEEGWTLPLPIKTPGVEFKLRLGLFGEVSGFVGATGEIVGEAIAEWKFAGAAEEKKKDETKVPLQLGLAGGINAFAGASVTASLGVRVEWFNIESRRWKHFVWLRGEVTGYAGVGVQAMVKIGWDDKKKMFTFEIRKGVALKLGAGAGFRGEADVNEMIAFIGGLLKHVDFAYIEQIGRKAFEQFTQLMVGMAFEAVDEVTDRVRAVGQAFDDWRGEQAEIRQLAENIVSGRAGMLLRLGSPEAKGAILGKLCERSGILSDEIEEQAIIRVLESLPTKRGLEKTIRKVTASDTLGAGIRKINRSVDWTEQDRFDQILAQHGLDAAQA